MFINYRLVCGVMLAVMLAVLPGCGLGPKGSVAKDENIQAPQSYPEENRVKCPLSGDMVPEGIIGRRPLAVMIENAPAARPQSGLDKADVVYEILAEGAITRFLAVYLHADVAELGPVRSARPYYIERMFEYNAMYAYCGGSEAAKEMVRRERVAQLDEFGVGRQAYWRVKGRRAPHNLYTDTRKLRKVGAKRGYEKSVKLPELAFLGQGEENIGGLTADKLIINYPLRVSVVDWEFNAQRKLYLRNEGGISHRDAVTGEQLTGSNIIVQYVDTTIIDNEGRRDISMVGRGRAVLFTGGKAYNGTWSKGDVRAQTIFYGENGEVLKLNPGQTWIEVVPKKTKVEYY